MKRHNNHRRKFSSFDAQLRIIRNRGFNPIAVSQLYCEDTFVFNTDEEAEAAYQLLEVTDKQIDGWWYGYKSFIAAVHKYECELPTSKVKIFWLNG